MQIRLFYIIFILFSSLSVIASAMPKQLSIQKFQIDNGLSHNTVSCTLQDSYGFIWFGTSEGLNRFDGRHFKVFTHKTNDSNSLGNNCIYSLFESKNKELWIGTEAGLYIYDFVSEQFRRFDIKTEYGVNICTEVSKIIEDEQGRIWIGTIGQGIFIFNEKNNTLVQNSKYSSNVWALHKSPAGNMYTNADNGYIVEFNKAGNFSNIYAAPELSNNLRNSKITSIYYKDGILWYGLDIFGLVKLDLQSRKTEILKPDNNYSTSSIHSIHPYSDRELLIGTENGLFMFDVQNGNYKSINYHNNSITLNDQSTNDIYTDREGGIWFSTKHGGVNYLVKSSTPFEYYHPSYQPGLRLGKVIRQFYEDSKGNLWIASENEGVTVYHPETNTFSPYPTLSKHINAILIDNDKLWLGTESSGIEVYDLKTGKVKSYQFRNADPTTISDNNVRKIFKTSYGDIYIGTAWGINIYNPQTDDFSSISQIAQVGNLASVSDIKEDSRGFIWFSTSNAGLFRHNPDNGRWIGLGHYKNNPKTIPSNKITSIFEDSKQQMWFSTEGNGICRYDFDKDAFVPLDPEGNILPSQIIYRIEEDENNNFWLSSNSGLICLNPETREILGHFTKENGLQSNQFNFQSSYRTANGRIYFGGINGFNAFYPRDIEYNEPVSNMLITNMYLYGEELVVGTDNSPLKKSVPETRELTLKHNQNSISFDFANLSYKSLHKKKYAYMMEGLENRWTNVGSSRSVFFNNIAPGVYTFRVKALEGNSNIQEPETFIKLHILPPFYKSNIAYSIYIIVLIFGVYGFFNWWSQRLRAKSENVMREESARKEKELYASKIEFFTNLVHEIRTPLSLIKIPLDYIIKSEDGNNDTKSYLKTIEKNTNRLLNLVNQLLDFRKVEESKFELKIQQVDIISLVEDICSRFMPIAQIRNIKFNLQSCSESLEANIDPEAITKIISNMLTNALKYTHEKIEVSISNYDTYFEISIADDGQGVAENDREKIFDTFYQADQSKSGTGIGLPLARLLAEKHEGKLFLKKGTAKGSTFIVSIPFIKLNSETETTTREIITTREIPVEPDSPVKSVSDKTTLSTTKANLLLVEDNEELLAVTASFLQNIYTIHTAENGKKALKILEEENINLIISDLMMPDMDGYELCEFVKNDTRYCHIPVIILTAKTSLNARLKGLEIGADAYIDKPYSLDHLLIQAHNLLENRRKLVDLYSTSPHLSNTLELNLQKKDKEFIDKLNYEIEEHIQDADFSLDSLAQIMYMSRSNFYRKIKGLFNMSPNDYLKLFRLRKSVALLQEGKYRIGEIYIMVGFSSPSYFTKCFKEQYGSTPKEYLTKKTANHN